MKRAKTVKIIKNGQNHQKWQNCQKWQKSSKMVILGFWGPFWVW